MRPEITAKQDWAEIETSHGTSEVPFDVLTKSEAASAKRGDFEPLFKYTEGGEVYQSRIKKGYGVRLSVPGYMDATEWEVYGSLKEAQRRARELIAEGEGGHATKRASAYATNDRITPMTKTAAQLDREIAEFLEE